MPLVDLVIAAWVIKRAKECMKRTMGSTTLFPGHTLVMTYFPTLISRAKTRLGVTRVYATTVELLP
jgi:hypothetical protein